MGTIRFGKTYTYPKRSEATQQEKKSVSEQLQPRRSKDTVKLARTHANCRLGRFDDFRLGPGRGSIRLKEFHKIFVVATFPRAF